MTPEETLDRLNRVPSREQLDALTESHNDHSRQINASNALLLGARKMPQASHPLPVKITSIIAAGKYYGTAYLPPYLNSSTSALSLTDLGSRTRQVILWNMPEINGSSPLSVGDVVDASVAGFDSSGLPLMKCSVSGGGGAGTIGLCTASNGTEVVAGDETTLSQYTYDLSDMAGNPLASGVTNEAARSYGKKLVMDDDSVGVYYTDDDDVVHLVGFLAPEVDDTDGCT